VPFWNHLQLKHAIFYLLLVNIITGIAKVIAALFVTPAKAGVHVFSEGYGFWPAPE